MSANQKQQEKNEKAVRRMMALQENIIKAQDRLTKAVERYRTFRETCDDVAWQAACERLGYDPRHTADDVC